MGTGEGMEKEDQNTHRYTHTHMGEGHESNTSKLHDVRRKLIV